MVPREPGQRGDFGGDQVAAWGGGRWGEGGLLEPGGHFLVEFGTKAEVGVLTWSRDRSRMVGRRFQSGGELMVWVP